MVLGDVANDDAVHRDRNRDQCRVDQGQAANPPDSKGFEHGEERRRELMQQRDGTNDHEVSFYRLPSAEASQ